MQTESLLWRSLLIACLLASACTSAPRESGTLFTRLSPRETGVTFANTLVNEPGFNILDYLYFYDGAGVALGDINGDGLPDLFFVGNQVSNRLYLNKGSLRFEDISDAAGIVHRADEWSTGVTMADVNGDGWLDIYVCQVHHRTKGGHNLLYINGGDLTFSEEAAAYGLDFAGLSTQAAFFDYDRDGDLDLYLLNHAVHTRESFVRSWRRTIDAPRVGDRLYRNDNGLFRNVTSEAGLYSSLLGYGLGLAISDINEDGWPDIYVGNDFHENDYLYFNSGDGTFSQALQRVIGHTSQSTMGVDVADINNDGRVEILALDMLPPDIATYRRSVGPDPEDVARIKRDYGYAPQYARNTLQLHRGYDAEGYPLFSEIGLYAGIHATDWSWAGLIADLDNDGWKDIFVTNGIPGRPNDLDYLAYTSQPAVQRILYTGSLQEQLAVSASMPPLSIPNYAFQNGGDLTFSDRTAQWGLDHPGFSNGAAYGDLDGDGDLDLVVNNLNETAWIYLNNGGSGNYLAVTLRGAGQNTTGIGAKVLVHAGGRMLFQEQMPTRGFQSSVPHALHFGLGEWTTVDSVTVIWPRGQFQTRRAVTAGQTLVLRQDEAAAPYAFGKPGSRPMFRDITREAAPDFQHRENEFEDYALQPLIPHRHSTRGPALAVADMNGDGLDDYFLGGAHGQAGTLFIQSPAGSGRAIAQDVFNQDAGQEDVDAVFFDADADLDLDVYVVSGGGQTKDGETLLEDRLYLNEGNGRIRRSRQNLPRADGCCVAAADFDNDGDLDLFVGSRSVPGAYGRRPTSFLLENDGNGRFSNVAEELAPALLEAGMVTAAVWADVTGTNEQDLVLVGEWMPVTVLENDGGRLQPVDLGLARTGGWWHSILAGDFDADGDLDLVAGNLGTNSILQPAESAPIELFVHDFDDNGTADPIVAVPVNGVLYSWARKEDLLKQIPAMADLLPTNASYAAARLSTLFEAEALRASDRGRAETFTSVYLENVGDQGFKGHPLPAEAQWSPVTTLLAEDFNGDGHRDILLAGNFFGANSVQGRYDADHGGLFLGDGRGAFAAVPAEESGFAVRGQARKMQFVRTGDHTHAIIIARNNEGLQVFSGVRK